MGESWGQYSGGIYSLAKRCPRLVSVAKTLQDRPLLSRSRCCRRRWQVINKDSPAHCWNASRIKNKRDKIYSEGGDLCNVYHPNGRSMYRESIAIQSKFPNRYDLPMALIGIYCLSESTRRLSVVVQPQSDEEGLSLSLCLLPVCCS